MKIYRCEKREAEKNTRYPITCEIQDAEDLKEAARFDHIASGMKGGKRGEENFLFADCIVNDMDNTHSDEEEDWKDLDCIRETFPGVPFFWCESRNSWKWKEIKPKTGPHIWQAPRLKTHIYFPVPAGIKDRNECRNLMLRVVAAFPYFDLAAAKPEQPMFGVEDPKVGFSDGETDLATYMASVTDEDLQKSLDAFFKEQEALGQDMEKLLEKYNSVCTAIGMAEQKQYKQVGAGSEEEQKKACKWFEAWAEKHHAEWWKPYSFNTRSHKNAIAYCVRCPWESEHSMNGAENETVVIIERTGQIGFLCRHDCHTGKSWKDFRGFYEEKQIREEVLPQLTEYDPPADKPLQLEFTQMGDVRSVIQNYVEIISNDKLLRGKIRHCALSGRAEIRGAPWDLANHAIRDTDLFNIRLYISQHYGIQNKDDIKQGISIVAFRNRYHPIQEALEGLQWDGVPRIGELFPRYLGAERSPYTTAVTMLLLHGAIQRVMNPGVKFDCCVILADTKQGTGKSSMCRFLAINDDWFSDELADLGNSKEAYEAIRGKWILELGEMLATRKTKDVESIKAYISRKVDNYREPYSTYSEQYPRQCIFIGTSNKPQFLPEDRTGNRRFLPLLCDGDKAERHPMEDEQETRAYILQCYAEAIVEGKENGWQLVMDHMFDSQLEQLREDSAAEDSMVGRIQEWLDRVAPDIVCSLMIWNNVFYNALTDPVQPKKYELQEIADCMNLKIQGWEKYRGKDGKSATGKYHFRRSEDPAAAYRMTDYGVQRAWQRIPEGRPGHVPKKGARAGATGGATGTSFEEALAQGGTKMTADGMEIPY